MNGELAQVVALAAQGSVWLARGGDAPVTATSAPAFTFVGSLGFAGPGADAPVNAFVCSLGVESVDAMLKKALDHGATIALPKMAIPGVGWQVYVKDLDGNILGLHQQDTSAK